ncbi:hypothetical protein GJAV_G00141700 [Gymnothorax javanicus]|nr:hypothetical protein GJAV_G00141700 [Gymnothorax javanicus]
MDKIHACKQKLDGGAEDFLTHLTFNTYRGIPHPGDLGTTAEAWEIRKSYILPDEACLDEIKRHAIHAQRMLRHAKVKQAEARDSNLHKATLTLLQTVASREGGAAEEEAVARDEEHGKGGHGTEQTTRVTTAAEPGTGPMTAPIHPAQRGGGLGSSAYPRHNDYEAPEDH